MSVGQEPGVQMIDAAHFLESGLREKVIEHLFVGDLLRCLLRQGARDIDVLRAEVDRAGYDLVLECNGVLRHVQLKSSHRAARTREVGININLGRKPSGCVIWIWFDPDTLDLGQFLWFGGHPSDPLPGLGDRVGRHSKGDARGRKAVRPNIRVLRKTAFSKLATIHHVTQALFGGVPKARQAKPHQPEDKHGRVHLRGERLTRPSSDALSDNSRPWHCQTKSA